MVTGSTFGTEILLGRNCASKTVVEVLPAAEVVVRVLVLLVNTEDEESPFTAWVVVSVARLPSSERGAPVLLQAGVTAFDAVAVTGVQLFGRLLENEERNRAPFPKRGSGV
jgi:hypothetical protein